MLGCFRRPFFFLGGSKATVSMRDFASAANDALRSRSEKQLFFFFRGGVMRKPLTAGPTDRQAAAWDLKPLFKDHDAANETKGTLSTGSFPKIAKTADPTVLVTDARKDAGSQEKGQKHGNTALGRLDCLQKAVPRKL